MHVIQHPRERSHPFGTVRLARLGLRRFSCVVADRGPQGHAIVPPHPGPAALLYPDPHAQLLDDLEEKPSRLVVVDGTWPQARNLLRHNAWLRALPTVSFRSRGPSRYRIRKSRRAEELATVEAIVIALQIIEPDTPGLGGLLDAFDAMIDQQLELALATSCHG